MNAIYNEIDPGAAAWLKGLADADRIVPGRVDTRSVEDLTRADVDGPGQRHFFAGIGGWSLALRYAGVDDGADIWTGSCPCQPFSQAGRRKGNDDVRHLWPAWFKLIEECRPPIVFGEQVASAAGFDWLSAVRTDLESAGYVVGGADLPACGVGAPHKRQRVFFVAYTDTRGFWERLHVSRGQPRREVSDANRSGETGVVDDSARLGTRDGSRDAGALDDLVYTGGEGSGRDAGAIPGSETQSGSERQLARRVVDVPFAASPTRGYWQHADWLLCRDGKARAVEPGTFPLAHGVSGRVGQIRGYGNAINPILGGEFVKAALEAIEENRLK